MTSGEPPRRRKSLRLAAWDYRWAGAYFVTIVTHGRAPLFGAVADGAMRVNVYGRIVWDCWRDLPGHYPHVELDAFIVMPNHVHGVIMLLDDSSLADENAPVGVDLRSTPTPHDSNDAPTRHGLLQIVRSLKTFAARRINAERRTPGAAVWQRNYYEHIIRNERELTATRDYILHNPARWDDDPENPARGG